MLREVKTRKKREICTRISKLQKTMNLFRRRGLRASSRKTIVTMSDDHVANILAFNKKLDEYRAADRYCDITIKVGAESFRCHRLVLTMACEYFDGMFGGSFREIQDEIVLEEELVNPVAFGEILCFAYRGMVQLSRDNVYSVLRASEFFKLVPVEEMCVEYIRCNLPFSEMLETFVFSCLTAKKALTAILSRYIMKNFDTFCGWEDITRLSFNQLNTLVSHQWYLPSRFQTHLLDTIVRWHSHSPISRAKLVEELLSRSDFHSVPSDHLERMQKKIRSESQSMEKFDNNSKSVEEINSRSQDEVMVPNLGLGLHVYTENEFDQTVVFSASKTTPLWGETCTMKASYDFLQTIGLNDYLYCLDFTNNKQTFRACPSLDITYECSNVRHLKPPPLLLHGFHLCNIRNNIFVSNFDLLSLDQANSITYPGFSPEQISQSIFAYDTEIDQWYPVPRLLDRIECSTLVACNDVLYLLEFDSQDVRIRSLDYRTSKWQTLSTSSYKDVGDVLCCSHQGKIYALHDSNTGCLVSVYDPVAGNWTETTPTNEICSIESLVSYENLLWAIGYATNENNLHTIEVYNDCLQEWSPSPIYGTIDIHNNGYHGIFKDCVVFPYY